LLEGYSSDKKNGVIYQIDKDNVIEYGEKYMKAGYAANVPFEEMAYLRLGYILSNLRCLPRSILDVGYGEGSFLKCASKIISRCYGFDVPPTYPLVYNNICLVDDIYQDEYDVVTFFDSLEHFKNIYEIEKLKTTYIVISLPWCHYYEDDEGFKNWKHRKYNEHLWHFNKKSLVNFFNSIGYDISHIGNVEDAIRKSTNDLPNILTAIFKKR
jgi:hypothetical protein